MSQPEFKIRKSKNTGLWNLYCRRCKYTSVYSQWIYAMLSIKPHILYFHKERRGYIKNSSGF